MSSEIIKKNVIVNADNEFEFMNTVFVIPESNKKYKVLKKYSEVEEYENESFMEHVGIGLGVDLSLKFYDEDEEVIEGVVLKK